MSEQTTCEHCHGTGLGEEFSDWYRPCKFCKGLGRVVEESESSE